MQCLRCGFSNPNGFKFCGGCGDRLSRICPKCNYENLQRARFCTRCGSNLGNVCPSCGNENLPSDSFCAECGQQLSKVCPECNNANPLHANFCNSCGEKLSEKAISAPPQKIHAPAKAHKSAPDWTQHLQKFIPPALRDMYLDARGNIEGEKKIVNMIFSDVSGFTALSERYADEPEEIQRVINECLRRQAKQVYALEGYVDKFVGDEMVALFGAPIWHEDDAQRAVMAAVNMRDAVEEYSDELEKEKGIRLHIHIGINTGRVSVGGMGDDMFMNYTVMGDAANLASRIEHVAGAGEIIVGELTYKLTRAIFDYKQARYVELKGKANPQPIYELVGLREQPESTRGIEGHATEMIGRKAELESLKGYAEKAFAENDAPYMASIIGEAGLGKSRLKEELKAELADSAVWIEGHCAELNRNAAYSVFLDAVKSRFGVGGMDTEEQVRAKITEGVHQLFAAHNAIPVSPEEDILPYLFQLMSLKLDEDMESRIKYMLDDPEHLQKQTFLAIKTLLLQIADNKPFVLALEDLHWVDDLSLDLMLFLIDSLTDSKGLILCIYRPEKQDERRQIDPIARERFPERFMELILGHLSDNDMELILESLLLLEESKDIDDLRELILKKAEGNPFYLEEVVRTLLEDEIVAKVAGETRYVIMEEVEDINVPTGVESVVRARIDRLTKLKDGSKQTLLRASVIGRVFERRVLDSISPENTELDRHLERLLAMGLIAPTGRIWPEQEYSFRHILTHRIAYDSVIGRERRNLHGQIGDCVEELYPEHLYPDKLEYTAGHYRMSDNHGKAAAYLTKAGHKARRLYNNAAAIDYYTGVLEKMEMLTEADDALTQAGIYEGLGDVYRVTSRFDEALESYEKARDLCSAHESRAAIYRRMGGIYEKKGNYAASKEQYESGLAELEDQSDSIELPRLYNGIGFIHFRSGEYSEAIRMLEKALEMLENKDDYVTIAEIYKNLAIAGYFMGNAEEAFANMDLSVEMAEKANDRMLLARLYNTKAAIYQMSGGKLDNAIQTFRQILEMRTELGDIDGQATTQNSLGMAYTAKGEYDKAISYLESSLELARRVGNFRLVADSYNNLGVIYWQTRQLDKSIECYQESREIYRSKNVNFARGLATCTGNIAEAYREKGDLKEAEKYHLEAIEMARQIPDRQVECHQYHGLGEIHTANGDYKTALEFLEKALSLAEELSDHEAMGDACKGICEVHQKTDRMEEALKFFNYASQHYTEIGAEAKLKKLQAIKTELAVS